MPRKEKNERETKLERVMSEASKLGDMSQQEVLDMIANSESSIEDLLKEIEKRKRAKETEQKKVKEKKKKQGSKQVKKVKVKGKKSLKSVTKKIVTGLKKKFSTRVAAMRKAKAVAKSQKKGGSKAKKLAKKSELPSVKSLQKAAEKAHHIQMAKHKVAGIRNTVKREVKKRAAQAKKTKLGPVGGKGA